MSQAEREEFLAGVHVGVLSVGAGEGRAPITTPVWYSYQPGGQADTAERIEITSRYLTSEEAQAFVTANPEMDDIVVRMTPDRWRTADFSKS